MILIDCGNSLLKAQHRNAQRVSGSYASRYDDGWARDFAHWLDSRPASGACLASVLDAKRQALLDSCLQARFGEAVTRVASEASALGVTNAYDEPERLGVDRWLALLAAADLCDGDCMIIDAGSAITLDLLRADGRHLGGAILPGRQTTIERFREIFSYIDFDEVARADHENPGCSTEAAIQLDYAQDSLGYLQQLVNRWRPLLSPNPEILLAGGDAARVQRALGAGARIVPDLVFRGLARLARS